MIIMGFLLLFAWFCGLLNLYAKLDGETMDLTDAFKVFNTLSVYVAMAFFASLISTAT